MSNIIKVHTPNGEDMIVNTDKILFATATDNGIFLTFKIKESGEQEGINVAMTLTEFLISANNEG